ncbi:MAG: acetyl-CoA carboxylase carboxyltransferase subunit beta [Alphaproteobacteria bacterium]|nr:acetyl-CoA carboxylase carboxyltransferase subunit beta [Alphaproteobacteria bacterium]
MNWITGHKRPTVKKTNIHTDVPDDFWNRCPACDSILFHEEIEKANYVCPRCGYHFKLPTKCRFEMMFDDGKYTLIQLPKVKEDPLRFADLKKYADRLKDARKKTHAEDAIQVAHGKIGKKNAVVGVFDFDFMGGSMGTAVGEAILTAVQLALLQEAALILVPASGGARMQEGMLSLIQMARTTIGVQKLRIKKLPYIVILTNPTTGGVTASFAMLGDITLAEPAAIIGFAGARVIEQTIHQKLPPDFQKAEYLLEHGMIDAVVPRSELRAKLTQILSLLMK